MMQVDKRSIELNLCRKGFKKDESHHTYFYHVYKGKRTGIYTYTSHGSKRKVYTNSLLGMMKRQLKLDSIRQVVDLFECPMSEKEYNKILRSKGVFE